MKWSRLTGVLFLLLLYSPAEAFVGFSFQNFSLGTGISFLRNDLVYPETPFYKQTDIKDVFIIDLRFDLRRTIPGRFVPSASFFRWAQFTGPGDEKIESTIDNFDLNFDYNYFLTSRGRYAPYVGTGVGFHITKNETLFPESLFFNKPIVVRGISENHIRAGLNFIAGTDIHMTDELVLFSEIRYDMSHNFSQAKLLIGISTY